MSNSLALDNAQATRWFHALSDKTRLEIIGRLAGGECCVCELTDALDAAQSRLSFHLRTLKDAGLVIDRRDGRWIYYALNRGTLEEIEALVGALKSNARETGTEGGCCS